MIERNLKLEAARRRRGWTLEFASQKIGVHRQTLRKWEAGKSRPQGFRIYKISEVYEMTPVALGLEHHYQPFPYRRKPGITTPDIFLAGVSESLISVEDLDLQLLGIILQRKLDRSNLHYHAFQMQIHQRIKDYDEYMALQETHEATNAVRLQALHIVAAIPIAAYLEHVHEQPLPIPPEDILTHCASGIAACWHMGQGEGLTLARSFTSGYILLLSEIFERFPYCRQAAATLMAQASLLRTMLGLLLDSPHACVGFYMRALEFSKIAEADGLIGVVPTYADPLPNYGRQPARVLEKMAEAIWLLKPTPAPPEYLLVRNYLQKIFPADQFPFLASLLKTEQLPTIFEHTTLALSLWDGLIYHELEEYARTLDDLSLSDKLEAICDAPAGIRLAFLPNRALAALLLHDMDRTITALRAVIPQVLSIGNEQKLMETRDAYHMLQFMLPGESMTHISEVKDLLKKHD